MSTVSNRFSTISRLSPAAGAAPLSLELGERISSLYALSERSRFVFGSPLGPFHHRGLHLSVPRFVYFGPHTHDESLRLAFLAGFDHEDLRSSYGLLRFIEHLVLTPDLGHGLNLSLFPLVDVLGVQHGVKNRALADADWSRARAPEVDLLQKDARSRGYHGFVRIETTHGDDVIVARLRGIPPTSSDAAGIELISSEDFDPLPVRWEADSRGAVPADGPLSVADDLPFRPFELTLQVPSSWNTDLYRTALSSILKRFILRYRGVQAHGHGI